MMQNDTVQSLIPGYKPPVKLTYNTFVLNVFSIIVFILGIVGFNLLRGWIEKGVFTGEFSGSIDFAGMGILAVIFVITILVHELVHGLFFWQLGYKVSFGLMLPIAAYTMVKNQLVKRQDYLLISLAPFVMINLICILLLFLKISIISDIAVPALIINTSGAVADLWLATVIFFSPKKTLFYDTSVMENFVYYPNED